MMAGFFGLGFPRAYRIGRVGALLLGLSCRGSDAAPEKAALTLEPERFSFALPADYAALELRGEGSETVRAPVGARVTATDRGFSVDGGPDFALEIVAQPPKLSDLAVGVARVFAEPDANVFKLEQGYAFAVVRELVPEWDEGQRQRFGCGSAGGAVSGAATNPSMRAFSKAATERMVAACRTLALPALE